jgi:hypothetical protein
MKIISVLENSIKTNVEKMRPPIEIRNQLDLGYSFEKNVLILFEIRPSFTDESIIMHREIVKARYYKSQGNWEIYWKLANQKWELFKIEQVNSIDDFFKVVNEDKYGCFFG